MEKLRETDSDGGIYAQVTHLASTSTALMCCQSLASRLWWLFTHAAPAMSAAALLLLPALSFYIEIWLDKSHSYENLSCHF